MSQERLLDRNMLKIHQNTDQGGIHTCWHSQFICKNCSMDTSQYVQWIEFLVEKALNQWNLCKCQQQEKDEQGVCIPLSQYMCQYRPSIALCHYTLPICSCTLDNCKPQKQLGAIRPLSRTAACITLPFIYFHLAHTTPNQWWWSWSCCSSGKMHFLMNSRQFSGLIAANRKFALPPRTWLHIVHPFSWRRNHEQPTATSTKC